MKHYVKPTVEMYSLSGNETICGGCGIKLRDDKYRNGLFDLEYGNRDGTLTKEEAEVLFGMDEACNIKIDDYCKFTSTAQSISWS